MEGWERVGHGDFKAIGRQSLLLDRKVKGTNWQSRIFKFIFMPHKRVPNFLFTVKLIQIGICSEFLFFNKTSLFSTKNVHDNIRNEGNSTIPKPKLWELKKDLPT